jgi:hypothetical protein
MDIGHRMDTVVSRLAVMEIKTIEKF